MALFTAALVVALGALALGGIELIQLWGLPPLLVTALLVQAVLGSLALPDRQAQRMAVAVAVAVLTALTIYPEIYPHRGA
jgi:hypothetical protein